MFLHRDLVFHGGVPNSFVNFAQYKPHRVELFVGAFRNIHPQMKERLETRGAKVIELGDRGYIKPAWTLRKHILEEGIQVCLACSFKSYVVAKLATLGSQCRVIFWIRGIPLILDGRLRKRIFRILSRNDTLIFISNAVKKAHAFPSHRGKEYIVYHGVVDPLDGGFPPYTRTQRFEMLGIKDTDLVLGYTAEFIGWKDHKTLIASFDILSRNFSSLYLVLIGTGQLMGKIKQEVSRRNLDGKVIFLGARQDAKRLLGLLDIYVHPARGEGFGLAVVEAMLTGIPVVVADEGSLPELVRDGENGLLFKAGDPNDLAQKVAELLTDASKRTTLGDAARQSALLRFSPLRYVRDIMHIIEEEIN
jgi:glycosyltransferase involved in cell wall biosynthesis